MVELKRHKKKVGNLELRTCAKNLIASGEFTTAEIIYWGKSGYCITIAYWIQYSEGFELKFVGERPFNLTVKEIEVFWNLAIEGQNILEDYFIKLQKEIEGDYNYDREEIKQINFGKNPVDIAYNIDTTYTNFNQDLYNHQLGVDLAENNTKDKTGYTNKK